MKKSGFFQTSWMPGVTRMRVETLFITPAQRLLLQCRPCESAERKISPSRALDLEQLLFLVLEYFVDTGGVVVRDLLKLILGPVDVIL